MLLQRKVAPLSSERAVLKFASVKSLKKRFPPVSTASSVSPPPAQGLVLPIFGSEAVTHLKVLPPSLEIQIQLVSEESEPGTLV